jgi:ABC-type uncharacterized transport system substrate-binding protein
VAPVDAIGNARNSTSSRTVGLLVALLLGPLAPLVTAYAQQLREHGYVEGQNVAVEFRFPTSPADRLSDIAADLVRLKPDVIFAAASSGVEAVRKVTTSVPIVALDLETDPLASGIVASLARPGGNVTGIFLDFPELGGKWLELLKDVAPKISRVAAIWDPSTGRVPLKGAEAAAPALRLQLQVLEARGPSDFPDVFRAATRARAQAILVLSYGLRAGSDRLVSARGRDGWEDPEGGSAAGSRRGAAQPLPAGREHENRQGPRPHHAPLDPHPGGPVDRMTEVTLGV